MHPVEDGAQGESGLSLSWMDRPTHSHPRHGVWRLVTLETAELLGGAPLCLLVASHMDGGHRAQGLLAPWAGIWLLQSSKSWSRGVSGPTHQSRPQRHWAPSLGTQPIWDPWLLQSKVTVSVCPALAPRPVPSLHTVT